MDEQKVTFKGMMELPRWADGRTFLKNLAFATNCEIEIDSEKGWIRETIWYKVTGTCENISNFERRYDSVVNSYNRVTSHVTGF